MGLLVMSENIGKTRNMVTANDIEFCLNGENTDTSMVPKYVGDMDVEIAIMNEYRVNVPDTRCILNIISITYDMWWILKGFITYMLK